MWSFWERETFIGQPDLVVVGSGIVGLNAAIAYASSHPQRKVLVIEAGHLPAGASTKNAGFACFGSPTELRDDLRKSPVDSVLQTLEKRWQGLRALRQLLGDDGIGYSAPGSYELFAASDHATYTEVLGELATLNELVEPVLGHAPYRDAPEQIMAAGFQGMAGAIRIEGEGQIKTGQMMRSLLRLAQEMGIELINGLPVQEVQPLSTGWELSTAAGKIRSTHCLIATNGFARQFFPELDLQPARAQVLITDPIPDLPFRGTYHLDEGYFYFRNVGDRVLLGGGRNLDFEGETTVENKLSPPIQGALDQLLAHSLLPGRSYRVAQRWTGIMGVGKAKAPLIQEIQPGLVAAVRLGGMGIAIGTLVGQEAASLLD